MPLPLTHNGVRETEAMKNAHKDWRGADGDTADFGNDEGGDGAEAQQQGRRLLAAGDLESGDGGRSDNDDEVEAARTTGEDRRGPMLPWAEDGEGSGMNAS